MKVPKGIGKSEIEIKKSRFLGCARYFPDPASLKANLSDHRGKFPGCSHVAYAYITGLGGDVFGMSDDREPKGTAGRPILEVVKGSGITNIIVLVVRYFGGTKLGTGGLVRAYSEAAKLAISDLPVEEHIPRCCFTVILPYALYQQVNRLIESLSGSITKENFGEKVRVEGLVPEAEREELTARIADLSGGNLALLFDHPGNREI